MSILEKISKVKRPTLGEEIPILIFRAFRHFSANYTRDLIGDRGATIIFQNAGRDLGKEVGTIIKHEKLEKYLKNIENFVKDARIGILIPIEVNRNHMVFQLDECITCAGMPNIGMRICHFEVGFTAGIIESYYVGRKIKAFESKCGANGEGICEVTLEINDV